MEKELLKDEKKVEPVIGEDLIDSYADDEDDDGFHMLLEAIESNRMDLLNLALTKPMRIDTTRASEYAYYIIRDVIYRITSLNNNDDVRILERLLQDENFKLGLNYHHSSDAWTILEYAMINNDAGKNDELVEYLKMQGATLSDISPSKLIDIAHGNHHSLLQTFLDLGVDVNITNDYGMKLIDSIIHSIYSHSSLEQQSATLKTFEILLKYQNITCASAVDLIVSASIANDLISSDLLKKLTADDRIVATKVITDGSVMNDVMNGHRFCKNIKDVVLLLQAHGVMFGKIADSAVIQALRHINYEQFQILIEAGGNINAKNENGRSVSSIFGNMIYHSLSSNLLNTIKSSLLIILKHPSLIVDSEVAYGLVRSASHLSLDLLQTILADKRVESFIPHPMTCTLNEDDQEQCFTLLEEAMISNIDGKNNDMIAWLRSQGAIWNPTISRMIHLVKFYSGLPLLKEMLDELVTDDVIAKSVIGLLCGLANINKESLDVFMQNQYIRDNINFEDAKGFSLLLKQKLRNDSEDRDNAIKTLHENGAVWISKVSHLTLAIENKGINFLKELLLVFDINDPTHDEHLLVTSVYCEDRFGEYNQEYSIILGVILNHDQLKIDAALAHKVLTAVRYRPTLLKFLLSDLRIWVHKDDVDANGSTALQKAVEGGIDDKFIGVFNDKKINPCPTLGEVCGAINSSDIDGFARLIERASPDTLSITDLQGYCPLSYALSSIRQKVSSVEQKSQQCDLSLVNRSWNILEIILSYPTLKTHKVTLFDGKDGSYILNMLKLNRLLSPPALEFYEHNIDLGLVNTSHGCAFNIARINNGTSQRPLYIMLHAYTKLISEFNDIIMCYLGVLNYKGLHARIDHKKLSEKVTLELLRTNEENCVADSQPSRDEIDVAAKVQHLDLSVG